MMMNQSSEDWLPPGWTVQVKVRKSGKKDKYYFEPSSQTRFNSRAEVFRYLKTAAICHSQSEDSRTVKKQPGNNVEVKKTIAKGLPPGWIREIRVTTNANRIRRDSFYIDPVNGNALRSIRDVHRYLTTGKVRKLAYKARNQRDKDIEFQHDGISSPTVPKKEMQAIGKARRQIIWSENSLEEPSGITNDEALSRDATSVEESMPVPEPNSGLGEIGTKAHCSTPPEPKDPEQSDGKNDVSEFVATPDESTLHDCPIEHGPTKNESKRRQRKTKDVNLPRRASKRLAGLEAEPVLEVKTGRRVRPVACEESDKKVANTAKWASQCPENSDVKHETKSKIEPPKVDTSPDSSRKEHSCADWSILPMNVKKMKSEDAYEQPKCSSFLLPEDTLEKLVDTVKSEDKADVKQTPLLKQPVEDLLADPCIAFAIKTLTGEVFDASMSFEASIDPSTEFIPNERTLGLGNKLNEKLTSPEVPATEVENDNVDEKLESALELPVGEILADPCIEFAIKTLTGEIPLDNTQVFEDYFHQLSTSKIPGTNANASNHVGSDYFYNTNVLSQKQQVTRAQGPSTNINFQSCGTGSHQQERNRNEFQRH